MSISRLSQDQMAPQLVAMLEPRVARLGYLGEFFKCAAHQPEALMSFLNFTEDLKRALPDRLTEVVALSVSTLLGSAYERHQHERLCLRLGFGEEWVREVEALRPGEANRLTEPERLVQSLVLTVVRRLGHDSTRELEVVVTAVGHAQAVAVMMLIGRYITHALIVNCLGLAPPVPSPLAQTN